ncbi:MAG: nickel pincer cofactor biosynthesis protein LarC [Pelosinus sp.]|nr:nickel pincer cofactor biosynthesis protein LarC [Pelosinus sp.]
MKTIYLECFAGISGNMLLGALINAGVPEAVLRGELTKLSVQEYDLVVKRVNKCGISAVYADVILHEHHHDAEHHHHHRHLPDIISIIDNSKLAEEVKAGSKQVFLKLAEAEAKVHGVSVNEIHFHEVGAVDAIVDIVGTVFGLYYLGIEKVVVSEVCVGSGYVQCAHGSMPVPAPATAELLRGIPYYSGEISREMTTPTGAAILAVFGTEFGEKPANFISETIGYGAGTRDLEIPNVLRLHVGHMAEKQQSDEVIVIEASIDDLNPQLYPYIMDKLLKAGVLDVWLQPVIMKKGRPGNVLSVLAARAKLDAIASIILGETSSIGLRYYPANRIISERKFVTVSTEYGEAQVKVCYYQGKVTNVMPEYEDCKKLAALQDIPLKVVQHAAQAAANKLYKKE